MNEKLIIRIKEEIKKSETNGNYENLFTYAYSENLSTRFLFMNIFISNSNLDISELYEDNISQYFVTYDDDGNVTKRMPYNYIKTLAAKILKIRKDFANYQNIINFIINNYFPSPEEFKNNMIK